MSFAAALFDKGRRDIVLAVDRRWADGILGSLRTLSDDGVKSLRLNAGSAVAFTGHAEIIASIVRILYGERVPDARDPMGFLAEIDQLDIKVPGSTEEFEGALNRIVPGEMGRRGSDYRLSVILAGAIDKKPCIVWWAKESAWHGNRQSQSSVHPYAATLPPEACPQSGIYASAHAELNRNNAPAEQRARNVLAMLELDPTVQSVGGPILLRRMSDHFRAHS